MKRPGLGALRGGLRRSPQVIDQYLEEDRRAVAERAAEVFRWVFLVILLVLNNFGGFKFSGQALAVNVVLLAWAVVNLVVTAVLLRGYRPTATFGLSVTAVDMLAGAALVYFSNGLTSPYVLALFLAIIASAVRFGLAFSIICAVAVTIVYLSIGGSTPVQDYIHHPALGLETAGRVFLFLVVALVTGLVGEELARERRIALSRAAEAEALQRMSSALAYSLEMNDLADVVLDQAIRLSAAHSGALLMVAEGRLHLAAYHGRGGKTEKAALARGDDLINLTIESGEPSLVRAGDPEATSLMVVPVRLKSEVLAVLRLAGPPGVTFTEQQFFMVKALAQSAAGPTANALRFQRKTREAITDGLTGLLNHREFRQRLDAAFSHFRRGGSPFSVMLIDVDHFKEVNDSMGHGHGDEILKRAADLVRTVVRDHDLVCRYGGDEFAVLLPDTGSEQARSAAERLIASTHRAQIPATPRRVLTFSIGVATCSEDGITAEELMMASDQALYFAKRGGRDRSASAAVLAAHFAENPHELLAEIADAGPQVVIAIARALDGHDPAGAGHASRVAAISETIIRRLGRPEGELELVRSASLLHESGRLSERSRDGDWDGTHAVLAQEVLAHGRFLPELVAIVRHHHERWDGAGGPDGLAGQDIPVGARVLGVAEAYEEMIRVGTTSLEALERIRAESGTRFDPGVVDVLGGLVGQSDRLGALLRASTPTVPLARPAVKAEI